RQYNDIEVAKMAVGALSAARADDYEDWLRVGMALHSVDDSLRSDWIQFSRRSSRKFREGECEEKWQTFTRNGEMTLGTLCLLAEQDGWLPPWKANRKSPKVQIVENVFIVPGTVRRTQTKIIVPAALELHGREVDAFDVTAAATARSGIEK